MQKFSEIKYVRPDEAALYAQLDEAIKQVKKVKSGDELCRIYADVDRQGKEIETMFTVASIRNTMDMSDKFYEGEMEFLDGFAAKMQLKMKKFNKAVVASPYVGALAERYSDLVVKNLETSLKLMNAKIVPMMIREEKLGREYSKTAAMASCDFRGETCNFYGLLKHMNSTDRAERKEAFEKWAALYESISDKLDAIYDKLVALRGKKAQALGFDSYIDYIYLQRERYDYTAKDVAAFRDQVRDEIVPVCARLHAEQAKRLGVDKLRYYDEELLFPDGNANPIGGKDVLVGKALEFYQALSPETAEFFKFMCDYELFDLETRPNKHMGGYCTFLGSLGAPFIFSNFNGTSADVDVLTHEAGHAFEAYTAAKTQPLSEMVWSTSEVDEIHSMSMEHFAYPYADKFFGEEAADKYRYAHLVGALTCIPYLVSVDEFQHRVFEKPAMTAKERRAVWHEIEQKYLPWRDYDGNEFLAEGGFWMQKQHIFLYPFYYVDYALAQVCAFQFFAKDRADHQTAWADYLTLCRAGGSRGYFALLDLAHLDNPFREGTVAKVMQAVNACIADFSAKLN